jgi:ATP-dependent DNA helicase RecG
MVASPDDPTADLALSSILPIGINQLLGGAVEGSRLELKATWDEDKTGPQLLKTLSAFANDLQNLNGGYVVIGVAEENGVAVRPVKGLDERRLDEIQKWVRGNCNRIEPSYMPVMDAPVVDGQRVLVLWAPASDSRPHAAPDGPKGTRKFWIRIGSETVEAKDDLLTRLMQQTARVPFDDRRAFDATNEDLRLSMAREFLHDVESALARESDAERVYTAMKITARQNGHTVPRNVGLLFFSDDPQRWFRGARIETAEFADDAGGDTINEKVFKGPLTHQLRSCLSWLESMTVQHLHKQEQTPVAKTWASYPFPALREALVNAVYHRSYEADVVEPTKVYLYPNRVEVISYPGPVDGIELDHLLGNKPLPPIQARNRRIGELLKELKLAEARGTGLPKMRRSMQRNGSPAPTFDFDAKRTYFRVTLPAHPEYVALTVLREHGYQKATGDEESARDVLRRAWASGHRSSSIATLLAAESGQADRSLPAPGDIDEFSRESQELRCRLAMRDYIRGADKEAHRLFVDAEETVNANPTYAGAFATTKLGLSSLADVDRSTRLRLLNEAVVLLERVIQMNAQDDDKASAWLALEFAKRELGHPSTDIEYALEQAQALRPNDERISKKLAKIRAKRT